MPSRDVKSPRFADDELILDEASEQRARDAMRFQVAGADNALLLDQSKGLFLGGDRHGQRIIQFVGDYAQVPTSCNLTHLLLEET